MQLPYSAAASKLKRLGTVSSFGISHSQSHWSSHDHFRDSSEHAASVPKTIMTLRTCSVNPRLANLPTIDLTISKLHWRGTAPPLWSDIFPCHRRNLRLFVSSLTRTLLQGSSVLPTLPMELRPLYRKKDGSLHVASISEASTEFPRKD